MLKRLLRRPLRLQLGKRTLRFNTPDDFEFALASRTEVPAEKIAELVTLKREELEREGANIHRVETHLVDALSKSLDEPENVGRLIQELDLKLFTQDHDWRSIIQALRSQPSRFNQFKKMALIKYTQYLGNRQQALQNVHASKCDHGARGSGVEAASAGSALRETLLFDLSRAEEASTDWRERRRLPKGETVSIHLPRGQATEIVLSRHKFSLVSGEPFYLLDAHGKRFPLRDGRNVVGRDVASDVVIDPSLRDVSRKHVIIEPFGKDTAWITDLSSHGTFVPAA